MINTRQFMKQLSKKNINVIFCEKYIDRDLNTVEMMCM
jgi:hypothetical protein